MYENSFQELSTKLNKPISKLTPLKLVGDSKTDSQKMAKAKNMELKKEFKAFKEELDAKVKAKEISLNCSLSCYFDFGGLFLAPYFPTRSQTGRNYSRNLSR